MRRRLGLRLGPSVRSANSHTCYASQFLFNFFGQIVDYEKDGRTPHMRRFLDMINTLTEKFLTYFLRFCFVLRNYRLAHFVFLLPYPSASPVRYISRNRPITWRLSMSRTAYLKAQLAAGLRLGEPRAIRRILRALDRLMPPWVVAKLYEQLAGGSLSEPPPAKHAAMG